MTALMGFGPSRRQKSVVVSDHFTRPDSATSLGSTEDGKLWVPMSCVPLGNMVAAPSYMFLPGVAGAYASSPSAAPIKITGDIDLRFLGTIYRPASGAQAMFAKWTATGNQRSYGMDVTSTGIIRMLSDTTGAGGNSTGTVVLADGRYWIKTTRVASTGVIKIWTAPATIANPVSTDWTQLGANYTPGVGNLFDSTAILEIGSINVGTSEFAKQGVERIQIRNNVLDNGTGIVYDADFSKQTAGARTFAEDANGATVTMHGGELGIASNQAYSPFAGFYSAAVLESNVSDCDINARYGAAQDGWAIVFRWLDPLNYGVWQRIGAQMLLGVRAGGSFFSYPGDGGADLSLPAVGDVDTVSLHGGRIRVLRNNKFIAGATDYSINLRATKHGILSYNSNLPRFDDFWIEAA